MTEDRLHAIIEAPGLTLRFGTDEEDVSRRMSPPDFGDSIPGGFGDCTFQIHGETLVSRGMNVRILGTGSRVAWEGRITQVNPDQHGGQQVQCEGWAAHLRDDRVAEIYCHRAYGDWDGPSVARRLETDSLGIDAQDVTADWDQTSPALKTSLTGPWERGQVIEGWFDAGPCRISKVWRKVSANDAAGTTGGSWLALLSAFDNPEGDGGTNSGSITRDGSGGYWTPATPSRYIALQQLALLAGGDSQDYTMFWRVALYGDHGLPLAPADDGVDGVAGSDAVAHAVGKAAPMLRFTTGPGGSIEPSSFIPPHLSFVPSVHPEDVVTQVAALGGSGGRLMDWGVYEHRTFFMRSPGTYGREWRVRQGEGCELVEQGDSLSESYNAIAATFTDASGRQHTLGPPGSGSDIEDPSLLDTSPTNPVNQAGIPRKMPDPIDLGVVDPDIALRLAQVALVELGRPMSKGEITLTGPVRDSIGVPHPSWAVRSGDRILVENERSPRRRTIVDKRYSHEQRQTVVSTDSPPNRLDTVLGRLRVGAERSLG